MDTTFPPSQSDAGGFDPRAYAVAEAERPAASAQSADGAGRDHAGGGETRGGGPSPLNHELVAMVCSRLAAAGITDADRLAEFQRSYSGDLVRLFDTLELGEALAHYGIGFGDAGAELPPWARIAGSIGGVAVLAMMHRPELLARLLAAVRERMGGRREPDEGRSADGFEPADDEDAGGAGDPGDAGDGGDSAWGDRVTS